MNIKFSSLVAVVFALSSVSIHTLAETKPREKGRRLTSEECARMELLAPKTATFLGMRGDGTELINAGKQGDFPEATEALVGWFSIYNYATLLRYPYEMAAKFGKECTSGKIRIRV